jgi:hypothetical protein
MEPGDSARWSVITEAEMLKLGARRATALEPVGSTVLLALPDGTTLKYDSAGELSNFNFLKSARYVLADGRPVVHDIVFYAGDFQPISE